MNNKQPPRNIVKKGLLVVSLVLMVGVLVASAMVLVRNARLHQGSKPDVASAAKPELAVVPSSQNVLSATSDTAAGDVLQGTAQTGAAGSAPSAPVSVKPVKPGTHAVCDESRKAQLVTKYNTDEQSEDARHMSMLNSPLLDGIQLKNNENKYHDSVITTLNKNLASSLSAIACTL